MEKNYMVILWNESKDKNYDISEHETLPDAIQHLIQHAALFERNQLVQKVDWMPKNGTPATAAQTSKMTPEEEALAKRPNPKGPPPEQPVTIDPLRHTNLEGKKSIFDGVVPSALIPMIQKDS